MELSKHTVERLLGAGALVRGVVGNLFISSEPSSNGGRAFTIRRIVDGRIETVGRLQQFARYSRAVGALERLAATTNQA